MKNPLLDAIKQMKAKRVAVVVGDADELGLPDMVEGVRGDSTQDLSGLDDDDDQAEQTEDENEGPEDPNEIPDAEDVAEGDDDEAAQAGPGQAEQIMGRKPFDKNRPAAAGAGPAAGDEIPDSVGKDLYDPEAADKLESSGKKPRGLFARANMKLHEKFGKK
jgi:hypothetical protein